MKIVKTYKSKIIIDKTLAKTYIEKKKALEILEKEIKDIENNLKLELLPKMEDMNFKNVISNGINASLINSYTKSSIDTSRLKKEDPDTYNKYLKMTNVSSYITLKISD